MNFILSHNTGKIRGMAHGFHALSINIRYFLDVLDNAVDLVSEFIQLVVGEREPRQARKVRNLVAGNRRHSGSFTWCDNDDSPSLAGCAVYVGLGGRPPTLTRYTGVRQSKMHQSVYFCHPVPTHVTEKAYTV